MERLYTPWRLSYIREAAKKKMECIFCVDDPSGPDRERLILRLSPRTIVMCNRFPYTNGHLLIAPRAHVSDFSEVDAEATEEIFRLIQESIKILRKHYNPEGFNVGMNMGRVAGAGIEDHVHFHVLPRWAGDTNFMTPVSRVRVLPETVEQTFDRLVGDFSRLEL
ncbi:MAG: HIT domain-containing protein [Deltaproteobacteria bacterium]|nr:MAG: HIT domain-containing protein [Deltaproteobacteria bacterium]